MLMSQAHNSQDLENFCIDFICLNDVEIVKSKEWKQFENITQQNHSTMLSYFVGKVLQYKQENFVQHSIEKFIKDKSDPVYKRLIPKPLPQREPYNWRRNDSKKGQLSAVQERPYTEYSSSSSNSSAGSCESERVEKGLCDIGSSSDGSDEQDAARDISEVSLQRLLQTSDHIFIEQHHPLSFYDQPSKEP